MNDTVALLQGFRRICAMCPHCQAIIRLSDTTPYFRSRPPRTALDKLDELDAKITRARDRFAAQEGLIRDEATRRGRLEMRRRLRGIARFYQKHRIELEDIKLLFDPVDYVAFRGLSNRRCSRVEFIDCEATSRRHEKLQRSLDRALVSGNISWITMRVADSGLVICSSSTNG